MSIRTITVHSPQSAGDEQYIETDVQTWGDLKPLITNFSTNNIRAVVRDTRNSLESNQALLPEGEFTLFLYHKQVKSGIANNIEDIYTRMTLGELRKVIRKRKAMRTESRDPSVLRYKIRAYDKKHGVDNSLLIVSKEDLKADTTQSLANSEPVVSTASSDQYRENNQNDAIITAIKELQDNFNNAFNVTIRRIQKGGISRAVLDQEAEAVRREVEDGTI